MSEGETKMDKKRKNMGVTQKAVIFRDDGKFLAIRRSETAPSYPLAWDLPGGELDYGEDPFAGIIREIKEETGLKVKDLKPFDVFGHENPVGFWVTIAYRCKTLSDTVVISWEHTEYRWVTKEEFLEFPSSPKIIRFVENVFK